MLELRQIDKRFGARVAADQLSLQVAAGETLALLGPSGCGKSTLLKIIAGLLPLDGGSVRFDGEDITGQPPERRGFALMFQDFALFPHLDVLNNVMFGLIERGVPRRKAADAATAMLERLGLTGYQRRKVWTLSGGEQQRVALARALSPNRGCCCWTNRFPAWTRICALSCGKNSRNCWLIPACPPSWSPMTGTRRSRWRSG